MGLLRWLAQVVSEFPDRGAAEAAADAGEETGEVGGVGDGAEDACPRLTLTASTSFGIASELS